MFSFVSVCPQGGSRVNITHNASDLTTQGPPDMFQILHLGHHCTGLPQTCSNLFHLDLNIQGSPDMFKHAQLVNLDFTVQGPPHHHHHRHQYIFKLFHYKTRMVGKWLVGILLEYFLVFKNRISRPSCVSRTTDTPNSRFTF